MLGMQGGRVRELAGPDVWETCRELIPAETVFAFLAGPRRHSELLALDQFTAQPGLAFREITSLCQEPDFPTKRT